MTIRSLPNLSAFVAAWQASASVADAAHRLGRTQRGTCVQARTIRTMGVPLKRFDAPARIGYAAKRVRGRKSLAVRALIDLAVAMG